MRQMEGRSRLALEKAQVLSNDRVADGVWLMELVAPYCARTLRPGQFVEYRVPFDDAEILRIPISVFGCDSGTGSIELLYQVVGHGTETMSELSIGVSSDLIGPIGNGWNPGEKTGRALLVSGGLGAAPLALLAASLSAKGAKIDICMGAPTSARLVGRERLSRFGEVSVATDDGSEGHDGFVTALSAELLEHNTYDYVATCGPGPMQAIVARQAAEAGVRCEVSLERLMACGVGACLSCVVETVDGKRRACVDGPVFDAAEVIW